MQKIVVLKTGSTLPALYEKKGDFEDWIIAGMGIERSKVTVLDVCQETTFPPIEAIAGVVITGSHEMVTDHLVWSERTAEWLRTVVDKRIPILGICYGHQLLAYALGGEVNDNPNGHEYGTLPLQLNDQAEQDRLLGGLPDSIRVQLSHTQSVLQLPKGAKLLGSSAMDKHQAFVVADTAWGVQFHPEFDGAVVKAYIEDNRRLLEAEHQDPDYLLANTTDTPFGVEILRRFAEIVACSYGDENRK